MYFEFKDLSNIKIFQKIYHDNLWGKDNNSNYYSGEGSRDLYIIENYIFGIRTLLTRLGKNESLNCVDLGCGDFNIGSKIFNYFETYTAVDIVPELIEYNSSKFRNKALNFKCLDICKDELPDGNFVILRQVFQHLSNENISQVLEKITKKYKYLLISEHLPAGKFLANLDKIPGPTIRLSIGRNGSGVVITEPPFNMRFEREEIISEVYSGNSVIKTVLYIIS